ncbi:RNA-binding CRS1 / YhbY domain-containing protein isoform 2 [Hibiscus syriacus]|uniref:RNA-binding CRS1 / YhbY domain-containing protein isoform 2 n=1 Tax=Hibiscus syriacus TaxID=106335 RepID=A0A6A2ZJH9_HIBSY|nr:RNA-binding CRS1 / YhbY domain-containing protein isoform 2 [Hibiscus syriacus]
MKSIVFGLKRRGFGFLGTRLRRRKLGNWLRSIGIAIVLGKSIWNGVTHTVLDDIHNHWKRPEAVRIKCLGVLTLYMDNVCFHLEVETMITRIDQLYLLCYGSLMLLYIHSLNGMYVNVAARVREAFETEEMIRLDYTHVGMSDCKRIGLKLRDLVPCVPILFKDEQIIIWRGKSDRELNPNISDANEKSSSM